METSQCDKRLPRFIGHLYAIIIHLMLHFSFVLGFFMFLSGIFQCGFVENDLAVVLFRVCSRTSVCLSMGNRLVEEAADVIAFVSTGDLAFEKTFVHMILSFSHEQRVKIQNIVL